jgi:DNA modification methylase
MELNKIYHMDNREGLKQLTEKCASLIISDPPYFEVKGEFDFVWKNFDEYLRFMEEQAQLYKRILADNGTLFVWGYSKHIAYVQVIFDRYFNLENSMVWRKVDSMQYQYYSVDLARTFNTHNERLLMYSNEVGMTGLEKIKLDINNFIPLRNYFKEMQEWIGVPKSEIIKKIGQQADHCFRWGSSQWDMPTLETYNKLITIYSIDKWEKFMPFNTTESKHQNLITDYSGLRERYEHLRRYFRNEAKLEEVLEFSQEGHITKEYDHDTKKPETLTRALILTCSRKDDLVVVPFAGSGTECAMAAKEGRRFVGFDVNPDYVDMASKRAKEQKQQQQLF